jgi:hypothetical protein
MGSGATGQGEYRARTLGSPCEPASEIERRRCWSSSRSPLGHPCNRAGPAGGPSTVAASASSSLRPTDHSPCGARQSKASSPRGGVLRPARHPPKRPHRPVRLQRLPRTVPCGPRSPPWGPPGVSVRAGEPPPATCIHAALQAKCSGLGPRGAGRQEIPKPPARSATIDRQSSEFQAPSLNTAHGASPGGVAPLPKSLKRPDLQRHGAYMFGCSHGSPSQTECCCSPSTVFPPPARPRAGAAPCAIQEVQFSGLQGAQLCSSLDALCPCPAGPAIPPGNSQKLRNVCRHSLFPRRLEHITPDSPATDSCETDGGHIAHAASERSRLADRAKLQHVA